MIYLPAIWLRNGAIVTDKEGHEHVLCHLSLGSSKEASSVRVVPVELCAEWWANEEKIQTCPVVTLPQLDAGYTNAHRYAGVARTPL